MYIKTQSVETINLRTQLRTLWLDRVMLTRMLLVNIAGDIDRETDDTLKKLRRNQEEIGDALKPYLVKGLFCWDDVPGSDTGKLTAFLIKYFNVNWMKADSVDVNKNEKGNAITLSSDSNILGIRLNDEMTQAVLKFELGGKSFEFKSSAIKENGKLNIYLDNNENKNILIAMLKNSITISKNFIKAKKARNIDSDMDAKQALKETAVSMAGFLSDFIQNNSSKLLESMLLEYINLVETEIVTYLNTNLDASLAVSEKMKEHVVKIVDVLVNDLTKQTLSAPGKDIVPV